MSKPLVVCTAGLKGSGKSLLSEVASGLGYHVVSLGDVVRAELMKNHREVSDSEIRSFSVEIRCRMGPAAVAALSVELVRPEWSKVMFDGLRSIDEYRFYKQRYGECVLIAVHASPRTRFNRLRMRARADDPKTLQEFEQRDDAELALGIGSLMVLADYHLVNDGVSQSEFKDACSGLLGALCAKKDGK
jgi:dephospho-CoA kinase